MDAERQAGDVLDGRYRLVEPLGRGGFGDVWRAEELLPDGSPLRQVALKLLRAALADAADWSAEARIIASLRHPALVTIYAAGVLELEQTTPYVAMELLLGNNLGDFVERGERVPWRRVLAWARETAAALDVIHRAGVVHLDLKPANLFLPEGEGIKVLDFGIARQGRVRTNVPAVAAEEAGEMSTAAFMLARDEAAPASSDMTSSMTRSVVGTPGFMAPEIFEDGEPGPATDAYALAACVVQLATGRLPQIVDTRPAEQERTRVQAWLSELQAATVRGRIRDLGAQQQLLPSALAELLTRWLALDPDARGITPGCLREQLDEVWRLPHGWDGNPYRGLASYRVEDEGRFFGRGPDVTRLARELVEQPCVVLHGAGGIGLRSLALAGVVPELARSFADDRHDWVACELRLPESGSPDEALMSVLEAFLERHEVDVVGDRIEAFMQYTTTASVGVVVVIDDLHAMIASSSEERRELTRFIDGLVEPSPGSRLVGTLAEEYAGELVELEAGARLRPWLRFMSGVQPNLTQELVEAPARAMGRKLADTKEVVRALQTELSADACRLPLVSLALRAWWERSEERDQPLGVDGWEAIGGVVGTLARHADAVIDGFGGTQRELAEGVLLRLVSIDGEAVSLPRSDIDPDDAELEAVVAVLLKKRLVLRDAGTLRLAHPSLATRWPWLHERRLQDIDRLRFLEELRQAAHRWVEAGRPRRGTLDATRLKELDARGDSVARELGDDERAFVDASRRAALVATGLRIAALVVVLAAIIGGVWIDRQLELRAQQQQRDLEFAQTTAAINHMVTRSRRTDDPYLRVALLSGAIRLGSTDPMLPLELSTTTQDLPPARFLSLERVPRPAFEWGPRWLVGGSGSHATIFDFKPPIGEEFAPLVHRFRTHLDGMNDWLPIPFDSAFVSRGLDGGLKVWRLREDGQIALAAVSPMRCLRGSSAVLVAERAPVIACATDQGLARWDLRQVDEVKRDAFKGRALHLSADGGWLAAARLRKVLLWNPEQNRRHELEMETAPSLARFSPRDALLAMVWPGTIEIHDLRGAQPEKLMSVLTYLTDPVQARWSDSGVDFAVCNHEGDGEWHYLREGRRDPDDPPPPPGRRPCRMQRHEWPQPLDHVTEYGPDFARRSLGPRIYEGGWRFADGRLLTRDLVEFDPKSHELERLVAVQTEPREPPQPGESVANVLRDGDRVLWQVGDSVRLHDLAGKELVRHPGKLLGLCPNGRALGWRVDGDDWRLFGIKADVDLARVKRTAGFVLATDPECRKLLLQNHAGQLSYVDVDGDRGKPLEPKPVVATAGSYVMDGYVYDARSSAGRGEGTAAVDAGVWLAFSAGAMVRVGGADASVTPYGHATPRASAMADGPEPGSLLFADETGVVLRAPGQQDTMLLARESEREWEDLVVLPDRHTVLLAWAHGVALLDVDQRAVVGEIPLRARGRFARWDDEGSLLVWPFSFMGQPTGEIIPIGASRAADVGEATSNLRARLDESRRPLIELSD